MTQDYAVRAFGLVLLMALPAILLVAAFGLVTGLIIVLVPLLLGLIVCSFD